MKFHLFFLLVIGIQGFVFSQSPLSISGYLTDSLSGERLIGATVYCPSNHKGTITDNSGYYSFKVEKKLPLRLTFSYVGYHSQTIEFTLIADSIVNIALKPNTTLEQITVIGKKSHEQLTEISKITLTPTQIKAIPTITGEPDLLKTFQLMPGVIQGTEGSSGLYVRGGSPDQNLFLLDDVPLYNCMHLGGMYSVFDPSALKKVDLYKGGFPAQYGGRISSIVDVRNIDGNLHQFGGEVGLSILLTKLFFEGPIIKNKASFMVSFRRSNLDLYTTLYNKVLTNSTSNTGYYFYDFNAKFNYIINDKNRVFYTLYKGLDNFYSTDKQSDNNSGFTYDGRSELKWGNLASSVKWQHLFAHQITNNLTFAFTKYHYANENTYETYNTERNQGQKSNYSLNSNIYDLILKSDMQIPINDNNLKVGFELGQHLFNPSSVQYSYSFADTSISNPDQTARLATNSSAIYVERVFDISERVSASIGFRFNGFFVNDTSFLAFEPRFVLNYRFVDTWAFKASYCHMSQYIHLLTNSSAGLPSDLWVPSTKGVHPEKSKQLSLGISHTTRSNYGLSVEAYYKSLANLIEYKEGVLIYSHGQSWTQKVETDGTGYSKGIEFMVEKRNGIVTGWISYTLSKSDRKFPNIQNGELFPFKYDQRHNISLVCNYAINSHLTVSATWQFHSGNAITISEGKYELETENFYNYGNQQMETIHIYSERNAYRMPSFHKLDIGLNYTVPKPKGSAVWNLGLYNAYNRQNAYYLYFKESNGIIKLYQQSLFPILFNFGYTRKF